MRRPLLAAAVGYLLGSLPSADVAARLARRDDVDLRRDGSGNPGGVNAAQVLGRRWGLAVIVADTAKGALAGLAGRRIGGDRGAYAAATAAVAGHIAPAWNGFRGGKGVATAGGTCMAVFPAFSPVQAGVAAFTAARSRHPERAIRITCAVWMAAATTWWAARLRNWWGPEPTVGLVGFSAASSAMMLAKFRAVRAADPDAARETTT